MRAVTSARSPVAVAVVVVAVLAAAACADDRPAGAAQVQAPGAGQVQATGTGHGQPTGAGPVQATAAGHVMMDPAELTWAEAPSLPPGAQIAVIEGPLDQPVPFTLRVRFPANYRLAAHRHPAVEHTTVLSGTLNVGTGDILDTTRTTAMPTGSIYIMRPDTSHFLWTTEEAVIQVHGVGPFGITYVNPADDPRAS